MRFLRAEALLVMACIAPSPAFAAPSVAFNVAPGRLSDALIALGEQAGLSIGASEPGLTAIRTNGLRGRMPARAALARLLVGTGYRFTFVGPHSVRVFRAAATVPPARRRRSLPRPSAQGRTGPRNDDAQQEIIVTATKLGTSLDRFAGSAHVLDMAGDANGSSARGTEAVVQRLPMLASTNLGPGRNKLFIRGVADSSFNGPSQAVVGQYLGDVRLTFNAPDPDLQLHDITRVEVLEGPQGTLYGSGSLGGIIRLVPNLPDLASAGGSASASMATTRRGDPGRTIAGTVNIPLVDDRAAIRLVGYDRVEGGFIDDLGRARADVNRTRIYGGRAALRVKAGSGWEVELGGVAQFLSAHDGQYSLRGLPPLSRRSAVAQPFDNDYQLGQLTIRRRSGGVELVSATAAIRHALETRFDATELGGATGPQVFTEDLGITLVTHESRVSHPDRNGRGWLVGWSLVHDASRTTRRLGPVAAPLPIAGVRNNVDEAALFGQYGFAAGSNLVATLGGRITYSHSAGMSLDAPDEGEEPARTDVHVSPTAALSWRPAATVLAFARFQQGFRAGGLAVQSGAAEPTAERFRSDRLASWEAGVRLGRDEQDRFSLDAAISYARWTQIQSDLVDARGLPYTTNIGDGRIFGIEAVGHWRPISALQLELGVFLNDSALSSPAPAFAEADERDLPNIADAGGRASIRYSTSLSRGSKLILDGSIRYVGEAQLGIGPPADVAQGDFADARIGARLDWRGFGIWLEVENLADARGNSFSYGNPFTVGEHRQVTPIRPRTATVGVSLEF